MLQVITGKNEDTNVIHDAVQILYNGGVLALNSVCPICGTPLMICSTKESI